METLPNGRGEPTMLIYYLFYSWEHEIRVRENSLIKFAGEGVGRRKSLANTKFKLSDRLYWPGSSHGAIFKFIRVP